MKESSWDAIMKEIDTYILTYFAKIEWYYGDNRAPFAYPAKCRIEKEHGNSLTYICELVVEDPGCENIIINAPTPEGLLIALKETINSLFTSFEHNPE